MPGADRDGLTAGPADRLQAVGGAIVALDRGLGHMSSFVAVFYCCNMLESNSLAGITR